MQLEKYDLRMITPDVCVTALSPDGRALSLYQDVNKSAQEIAAFSEKDAANIRSLRSLLERSPKSSPRRSRQLRPISITPAAVTCGAC